MANNTRRLLGNGCIWLSDIGVGGQGTGFVEAGETPALGITINWEERTDRNTCERGSPEEISVPINMTVAVNMTSKSFHKENLARFFSSQTAEVTTSTLTDQVWLAPDGVEFEEDVWYVLPNDYYDVGTLTFKDNAGTPVAITNTKYEVNKRWGRVRFTDLAGYTVDQLLISGAVNQPSVLTFKIEKTGIATGIYKPFILKFEGNYTTDGINEQYGGLILHKVQLNPGSQMNFKSPDDFMSVDLTGKALANADLPTDDFFGKTGKFIWLNDGA